MLEYQLGEVGQTLGLQLQAKFKNNIHKVYGGLALQQDKKNHPYRIGPYTPGRFWGLLKTDNLNHTFTWHASVEYRSGARYEIGVAVDLGSYHCYYFETGVAVRH